MVKNLVSNLEQHSVYCYSDPDQEKSYLDHFVIDQASGLDQSLDQHQQKNTIWQRIVVSNLGKHSHSEHHQVKNLVSNLGQHSVYCYSDLDQEQSQIHHFVIDQAFRLGPDLGPTLGTYFGNVFYFKLLSALPLGTPLGEKLRSKNLGQHSVCYSDLDQQYRARYIIS